MQTRVVALTVLSLLAAAAPAQAGTATSGGSGLSIVADEATGVQIRFNLESAPGGLEWVVQSTKPLTASVNCRQAGTNAVRCTRVAEGVSVTTGAASDFVGPRPASGALSFVDEVTASLGGGPDSYSGFAARDVVTGGSGIDNISGFAGPDSLVGGPDRDQITPGAGRDDAIGGSGDDVFVDSIPAGTNPSTDGDDYSGGTGFDVVSYIERQPILVLAGNQEATGGQIGSSEGDSLRGLERYVGGPFADRMNAAFSSVPTQMFGANGNDQLFGSSANDTLTGGDGSDVLDGNAGNDVIDGKTGEQVVADEDPTVDCGPGSDLAVIDLKDDATPTDCESIDRAPLGERPDAKLPRRFNLRARRGAVTVLLRCPRRSRRGCKGSLALRKGRRVARATRYRIRRGGRMRVRVRAPFRGSVSVFTRERATKKREKSSARAGRVR